MGTPVTIHGGHGSDTISFAFTVTGTNTTLYTQAFVGAVNGLLGTGGGDSITPLAPDSVTAGIRLPDGTPPIYVLTAPTDTAAPIPTYSIPLAGYVLDTISGAANINLDSAGGDTVLVAAINAEATVTGAGGDNQIIFVTGNNEFVGTADTGGDTAVAGSGFDTIYTSAIGATTVNSGTGNATIYLQDTDTVASSSVFNDFVWLDDGVSTVYANGVADAIITTVSDQTIYGDSLAGAGSNLGIVLSAGSSADSVSTLGSDTASVFDSGIGSSITGGSGVLFVVAGSAITATVDGGTGSAFIYGGVGDSITLGASSDSTGVSYLISGGNETLNGASSTGTLFGYLADGDSVTGANGKSFLTAGAGSETMTGGTGINIFQVSDAASAGGSLTINDFLSGTQGTLILDGGFTSADVATIENSTNDVGGNLVVTISDSTTLTFSGITSGSQLTGHIITF
jgi:hypothetical protein